MKIVFLLFSRLTGKKNSFLAFIYEIFPCLVGIYFGGLLGGKILREGNIQNGWHKLEEKWLSFIVIWTYQGLILMLCLMGVLQLLRTQRQHKTFVFFTNIKAKNNCLKFLVNRIITELLLQCIEWLRNTFLHLLHRKKLSHSAGKMRSYEKIFPRLTEILVSCWRDLG